MASFSTNVSRLSLLLVTVLCGLLLAVPLTSAQEVSCNQLLGVSGSASENSGVMDFEYALYSKGEDRAAVGTLIDEAYRVCVNEDGTIATSAATNAYAWNSNVGWMDFAWCVAGDCTTVGQPTMDPATGYWSGYIWSSTVGWLLIDWSCASCDTTQRMRTDLTTGLLSGYVWSDSIGWVAMGGASMTLTPSELTGYVSVVISPDPLAVTKETAPLADGEDKYGVAVEIFIVDDEGSTYPLSDDWDGDGTVDYEVAIKVNSTADSVVCLNQIAMTCTTTEAIYFPDAVATYDDTSEMWWVRAHAYAPTSNVNGYDSDGDGSIDYYFDVDPTDPEGLQRSSTVNRFEIASIDLTVTPLTASAPTVVWDDTDPLYNLDDAGETVEFKFAPAVEVANLERLESSSMVSHMSSVVGLEQSFEGLVVKWSWASQFSGDNFEFTVRSILNVEMDVVPADVTASSLFEFLFDNQPTATLGDGAYNHSAAPMQGLTPDSNVVDSKFIIATPDAAPEYLDKFVGDVDPSRTVYVSHTDHYKPLKGGSIGDVPNTGMIVSGPATIDPEPSGPRYETQISYYLASIPGTKGDWVRYYSNYLPQTGSTLAPEDIEISGSVTSSTDSEIDISTLSSGEVVVLGDLATVTLRNELFKRFSELTKGVTPPTSSSAGEVSGALELNTSFGGVELLEGDLIYFKDQDVHVTENATHGAKTIVVWGGNVYLDSDLNDVGVVAFQDNAGNGGHVYIKSSVIDLVNVNIFSDQPVSSYDPSRGIDFSGFADWLSSSDRAQILKHQLYIKGNLVSLNTLYGSDEELAPNYILANGQTTSDLMLAKEYDLNRLREFSVCWIEVDILGNPVDIDGDGDTTDGSGNPDPEDVESCAGAQRSDNIDSTNNVPVYFDYSPPSSALPILGESQAGKVNIF